MRFMTRASTIIALSTLVMMTGTATAATCDTSTAPVAPAVPAATERSTASMLSAQTEIKSYINATKEHLKCVSSSRKHNALVDQIYAVADEYNTALQEFKASTR